MKKLINIGCLLAGIILMSAGSAFAQQQQQEGDIVIGGGLIYGTEIENLGIRADGYYRINEDFRAGAALGYFFPEDFTGGSVNWFEIDFNGNYIFYEEDELMAYGLAGLNFLISSINRDEGTGLEDDSSTEVGLNIGAGLEYLVDFGSIFGELKLAGLGGDADQLVLGAGVRFPI